MHEALTAVVLPDGSRLSITFALGYVTLTRAGEVASELMERADLALAAARAPFGPTVVRFEPEMRTALVSRLRAEAELREGLGEGRLVVHYQPIINLTGGEIESVEALVRMQAPVATLIPPDEFIPLAEDLGLISQIGETVMVQALRDRHEIVAALGHEISVAVNVSARQLGVFCPTWWPQR